jgi:hypothetical protein
MTQSILAMKVTTINTNCKILKELARTNPGYLLFKTIFLDDRQLNQLCSFAFSPSFSASRKSSVFR